MVCFCFRLFVCASFTLFLNTTTTTTTTIFCCCTNDFDYFPPQCQLQWSPAIYPFSIDAKMGKSRSIVDPWVFKMLKRLKPLGCPAIKERERPRICIHIGIYTEGQSELASEKDPAGTWRHNCWLYQAYLTPRATHPPPSPLAFRPEKYTCGFNVLGPTLPSFLFYWNVLKVPTHVRAIPISRNTSVFWNKGGLFDTFVRSE